jgi:hypothetical protein
MGRRNGSDASDAAACARWAEAAQGVEARFAALDDLPMDEALEAAARMTPGGPSRAQIADGLAARRRGDAGAQA